MTATTNFAYLMLGDERKPVRTPEPANVARVFTFLIGRVEVTMNRFPTPVCDVILQRFYSPYCGVARSSPYALLVSSIRVYASAHALLRTLFGNTRTPPISGKSLVIRRTEAMKRNLLYILSSRLKCLIQRLFSLRRVLS